MTNVNTNLVTDIKKVITSHHFFAPEKQRVISDIKEDELSIIIRFKEPGDEISSQFTVLRGKFREEGVDKIPAYILFITLGSVIKLEIDENLERSYKFMLAPVTDDDNIELDFKNDFTEEEFFQQSTIHDFRSVTYEHVELIKDMIEPDTSYEKYLDGQAEGNE